MSYLFTFLVGCLFYWIFSNSNKGTFSSTKKELPFEDVLYSEFGYIIALVAKLAKSDGHVSNLEVELIENILDDLSDEFNDPIQARSHLKLIFNEEKDVQDNVEFVTSALYKLTKNETFKHQKILEFLVTLAFIDGELHPREKELIIEASRALNVSIGVTEHIFTQFSHLYEERTQKSGVHDIKTYCKLLDISLDYDEKTLKRAYKKKVRQHHPDVIMGKGGSEEDIQQATVQLQNINEAYEYLKKQKGF